MKNEVLYSGQELANTELFALRRARARNPNATGILHFGSEQKGVTHIASTYDCADGNAPIEIHLLYGTVS